MAGPSDKIGPRLLWRLRRRGTERPAPLRLWLLFGLVLGCQLAWGWQRPPPAARAADLTAPPALPWLRLAALGEEAALARLLMLWLQSFDHQPGISLSFRELDYGRLTAWLERILALDRRSRYPLVAASRLYAAVDDPTRKRAMIQWIQTRFADDPSRHWHALAHVALLAKHELHDLPLALELARSLARHATPEIPHWATQMEIFLLAELGSVDAARILLGGLLDSGTITDPRERTLLLERLTEMEAATDKK